jgi:hypothetical protein
MGEFRRGWVSGFVGKNGKWGPAVVVGGAEGPAVVVGGAEGPAVVRCVVGK